MNERPCRSALFVPGANARAMGAARTLAADMLIFDLEDAVAPSQKVMARAQVAAALGGRGYGRRTLALRVNAIGTEWAKDDLAFAAKQPLDAIFLPKVESAETVHEAATALPPAMALWCMIETPKGVLRAEAIAGAGSRVVALVAGTQDLAKDLHAEPGRDRAALVPALAQIVLVARAAGLMALDGIHADLDDNEGFESACRQGRALGFDGKSLIHPKQIEAANRAFAPAAADLAYARRIIAAYDAAVAAKSGVTTVDGRLVERLHVEEARRLLALAEAIAALEREA
jgi:citrate lyase subunit beta / citryl-CoA lyase